MIIVALHVLFGFCAAVLLFAGGYLIIEYVTRAKLVPGFPPHPDLDDDHGGIIVPGLHAAAIQKHFMRSNILMSGIHPKVAPGSTWAGMTPEAPKPMVQARTNHKTLDAAWADALLIGDVECKQSCGSREEINASITFKTGKGSTIWARGKGFTALEAINAALDEALALQAGVIFAGKE